MNRKIKKLLALTLIFVMSLSILTACGSGSAQPTSGSAGTTAGAPASAPESGKTAEPVVLRLSGQHAETNDTTVAMQALCDEVFEKTEGRVKIEIFPANALGGPTENLAMLDTGICDLVWTSPAFFAGQFPWSSCTDLPMLGIPDGIMCTQVYWDVMEKFPELFTEFDDYYPWIVYNANPTMIGTRDVMINSVNDLKGLNIRTASGIPSQMATAWGAAPTTIAPPDLYLALEKGTVDGYMFNSSALNAWKLDEISTCCVDAGMGFTQCLILGSKDAMAKLSPEDQAIMAEVGGRAGSVFMAEKTLAEGQRAIEAFEALGGTYKILDVNDPLYAEMKAPLQPIIDEWVATRSADGSDAQSVVDYMLECIAGYSK